MFKAEFGLIVIFNLPWSEFVETNATFRSARTTDLDHAFKICRSRSKRRIRFHKLALKQVKNYYQFDSWSHNIFYIRVWVFAHRTGEGKSHPLVSHA